MKSLLAMVLTFTLASVCNARDVEGLSGNIGVKRPKPTTAAQSWTYFSFPTGAATSPRTNPSRESITMKYLNVPLPPIFPIESFAPSTLLQGNGNTNAYKADIHEPIFVCRLILQPNA
jgi:hypothetical protein